MEDDMRSPFNDWGTLVGDHHFESRPKLEIINQQNNQVKVENIHHDQEFLHHQDLSSRSVEASNDHQKKPSSSSSSSTGGILWKKVAGSLAERRAAKCGFNAAKITVARCKTTNPVPTPHVPSPFLTIPSGISPAALLDSPIMLPNTQAQSSPTTGTFQFPPFVHDHNMMLSSLAPAADGDRNTSVINFSSSQLKPHQGDTISMQCVSSTRDQPSPHMRFPSESPKTGATKNFATNASVATNIADTTSPDAFRANLRSINANLAHKQTPQKREHIYEERGKQHLLEVEKKGIIHPPATVPKSSDDGYNWRKYGQKHVKGSEYPRSYFKCTHSNCPVKKKVERSHDGEITEIVYKGVHNHPKSQLNGRSMFGPSHPYNEMSDMSEGARSCFKVENGMVCRNMQPGCKDHIRGCSDWRADGLEGTSSTSVLTESSDPLSGNQAKSMGVFESAGTPDLSSTLASHDGEDEDRTTQGSTSFGEDGDGDESEAKRRKKDSSSTEAIGPSRCTREPKVVVQIESEIDVLDDGYRWRKYGQKVVKGNPNPRSYYKCTSAGCPVRKHVERASDNLKSVITTYEGKHNHEVPSKTNNTPANCNIGNFTPAASNTHSTMTLRRSNSNLSSPGMQVQDYPLHFDTKPARGNEFMRTNLFGNIVNDMSIGASSIYQLAFPALANPLPYSPFLINSNPSDICPSGTSASLQIPNSSMALPLTLPGSPNMALGSYRFNNYAGPSSAIQSSMGGQQQLRESDARLIKPKEEQKDDDNIYDTCLSIPDQDATSSFFHVLGNF